MMRETPLMATVDDREAELTVVESGPDSTVTFVTEDGVRRVYDRAELQAAVERRSVVLPIRGAA